MPEEPGSVKTMLVLPLEPPTNCSIVTTPLPSHAFNLEVAAKHRVRFSAVLPLFPLTMAKVGKFVSWVVVVPPGATAVAVIFVPSAAVMVME